jgi:hypothetical protein
MMYRRNIHYVFFAALIAVLAGCASKGESKGDSPPASSVSSSNASQPAASSKSQPNVKSQASSSSANNTGGIPPGMNAKGEVIDSSKVEDGHGTKVTVGDVEGEITGKAVPGSKFGKVKIGMSMKQVFDLIGQPSDQGVYITGKAFIPFYYGGDSHRYEAVYKNTGRLVFSGGGYGEWGSGHLIWIIHNAHEPASR